MAFLLPLAIAKYLLLPLAGIAFVVTLLLFGAFGLVVSMAVISVFQKLWAVVFRRRGGRRSGDAAAARAAP